MPPANSQRKARRHTAGEELLDEFNSCEKIIERREPQFLPDGSTTVGSRGCEVIYDPTWPVEWKQITPFLGWQDYMWTGEPDLAAALVQPMYERTMISFREEASGLLDTSTMGRHIVDWMPDGSESDETVARHEFTASKHMSVSPSGHAEMAVLLTLCCTGQI